MARKQIVILGGGTGGTMTANRLRRRFDPDEAEIHVVDRDDRHVYQPGLLFVPFGLAQVEEIVRPRRRQLRDGVVFHENEVESVALDKDEVQLDDGTTLPYDVLVVATGVRLQPEETEGMTGPGWNERVFSSYSPDGAAALQQALERFDGGQGRGEKDDEADRDLLDALARPDDRGVDQSVRMPVPATGVMDVLVPPAHRDPARLSPFKFAFRSPHAAMRVRRWRRCGSA